MWSPSRSAFPPGIGRGLLLAILLGTIPFLGGLWLAQNGVFRAADDGPPPTWLGEAPKCNPVAQTCQVGNPGRRIALSISSLPRPLQAFPLRVYSDLPGTVDAMTVELDMLDMAMAANQVPLEPRKDYWAGDAVLPICTSGRNDWRLLVSVKSAGRVYQAAFFFTVET